ncbi:nucleotidyltransferase family protein [Vibrio sp. DW001]|uniref:nucleotidyltransferase family protein n=1 Tax=Vibrio sp. DW001 TaxID=2912315 RepID=UPI0023AF35AC|nr:nucleotidyltransferase family protein [Vibrio sp. DW001]WED25344.1 nucleotidyltransferase family protein [Vibrio sp. DW001]
MKKNEVTQITELLEKDAVRLQALNCVQSLQLPDCYVAAGFIRNMVWDFVHGYRFSTPLNDVDVIYFDNNESSNNIHEQYEQQLSELMPDLNWQVRNQAKMHVRNGDKPYKSALDAMGYWVEKETSVAARILDDRQIECISVFGFESLFQLKLTHNPKRDRATFEQRVSSKGWLIQWPKLTVHI